MNRRKKPIIIGMREIASFRVKGGFQGKNRPSRKVRKSQKSQVASRCPRRRQLPSDLRLEEYPE